MVFSLEGCQIVAGGRSEAQNTGTNVTPQGWKKELLASFQGAVDCAAISGGLRFRFDHRLLSQDPPGSIPIPAFPTQLQNYYSLNRWGYVRSSYLLI